jgi:diguanylate cyclase (GGDEF)-like protein/PAS domain S-box-containing protein
MSAMRAKHPDGQVFRFDQSGALLRKVMESAAIGMTLVGADGRMIYANRAYEAMVGYPDDGCLGLTTDELVFADDRQQVMLRVGQVMRGEIEELHLECRMLHRDGSPIWSLVTASLLRSDATGRPLYAIIQVVDIDRQKRAEEALAESESRWNFALESARQGVWDHDIRKDDMFYSRMWRRMRGMSDDDYVDPAQESWLSRVHPEDVARIRARVKLQDSGEDGYDSLEYRERHRDGHWIWILSRGKPVEWDADGTPLRTVGTDSDITAFKQVEAALAEEKERLRVTLESIGDGVISTDAEERIVFMNPIAEAMTGWVEADAMGRRIDEVFSARSEHTDSPVGSAVSHCLASGELSRIDSDAVLHGRDGASRPIRGTAASVRTETGQVIGTVLVFQDITESRELHRQLAYSASHDPLTGLPNRTAFDAALAEAQRQAGEEQRRHTLCFIDLDRFKQVNDTAGHAAGDALLREVAKVIRGVCRRHDFAARIGGDEFVVLLADCACDNATKVATKLTAAIARMGFRWEGQLFEIGASIGVAEIGSDQPGHDPLCAADTACYAAKAGGRNRVVIAG